MEDVICPECNTVNGYHNNYCSNCGVSLKGTCVTCNREENVTFVEAGVCQWHVLEDREELKERFKILNDSLHSRFLVLFFGAMAISVLVSVVSYDLLPLNLRESGAMIGGFGIYIFSACYLSLLMSKRIKSINSISQTEISNFKESHPTEAELLERVGWKIL